MKYAFPQFFSSPRLYTWTVVAGELQRMGHTLTSDIDNCDVIGVSLSDVRDMSYLRKLKEKAKKPILCGGCYTYNYKSAGNYADLVWIGEVFEMAKCQTIEELAASPHCYTGDPLRRLFASWYIDWEKVKVVRTGKNYSYYWGGVGCKNKCRFCFTSWTHRHQENTLNRIRSAQTVAKKQKTWLSVVSNMYDTEDNCLPLKDMLAKDYLQARKKPANTVRIGIEFSTEEIRAKMGKPISKDELAHIIQRVEAEKTWLKLFLITGYEPISDWENFMQDLEDLIITAGLGRQLCVSFTNLQYQNYTPLYKERKNIDWRKYIDYTTTMKWSDHIRNTGISQKVKIYPPMGFKVVACRTGVEQATTKDQAEYWFKMQSAGNLKRYTEAEYQQALFDSGVLDTPELRVNFQTGEILTIPDNGG